MHLSSQMSSQFFGPLYGVNPSASVMRRPPRKQIELIKLIEKIPTLRYPDNYKSLRRYRLQIFKSIFQNPLNFAQLQNTIKDSHLQKLKDKWGILFDLVVLRTLFQNNDLIQSYESSRLHSYSITTTMPPLTLLFKRICKACVKAGILSQVPFPLPALVNPDQLKVLLDNAYRAMSNRDLEIEFENSSGAIKPNSEQLALLEMLKQNPISTTALTKLAASLRFRERIDLPDGRMLDSQHKLYDTDIPAKNAYEIYFNLMVIMQKDDTVDVGLGTKLDKLEVCVQAMRYEPGLPFSYVKTCELINRQDIVEFTSVDGTTLSGCYQRKDLALRAVECELKIPEAFNMLADCLENDESVYIPSYGRFFTKKELYEESLKLDPDNFEATEALALINMIYLASFTAMSQ